MTGLQQGAGSAPRHVRGVPPAGCGGTRRQPSGAIPTADWRRRLETPFRFLSDLTAWVCAQYGVAKQLLVHEEWVNLPSAFIVDKAGILRYAHIGRGWPMSERATARELLERLPEE